MQSRFLTTARIAGLLYLVVAVCGLFAEAVRASLVDSGDATATAQNIRDSEWLFRLSFSSDIVTFTADVALALVFFALFKPVNETLALLAAFFRVAQAAVLAINLLNQFMALLLLSGEHYLAALEPAQLDALVLLFMEAHTYGYLIGLVFFGVSTFVLGYLVYRSGAFPRPFGLALMALVPFGYLADSFTSFLGSEEEALSTIFVAPAALTELAFVAWLLWKGGGVRVEAEVAA